MRTKEELSSLISDYESRIGKMKADLDGYYEALEPQVDPLVKKSNELEASKADVKKESAPVYFWIIIAALVVAAIAIPIAVVRVIFVAAAVAVGVYLYKMQSKYDAEYNAQIAEINKKQDAIEKKIDKVYASDPRIKKTEDAIEKAESKLKALKIECSDLETFEKLGTNNLIFSCNFLKLYSINKCLTYIDGQTLDLDESPCLYYLNPGEHEFCLCIWPTGMDGDYITTEKVKFSVNDTNKYIKMHYKVEEREYETFVYDTFEEFAPSPKNREEIMQKLLKQMN